MYVRMEESDGFDEVAIGQPLEATTATAGEEDGE